MSQPYSQWKYRVPYSVTNKPTASYHQVPITVTWKPGMRRDFSDIRFATDQGDIFPYWIETSTTGTSASVWIKLPQNCAKFFCYYGNGKAVSESSGDDVFEFFDDFSFGTVNTAKWDKSVSPPDSEAVVDGVYQLHNTSTSVVKGIQSKTSFGTNTAVRTRTKTAGYNYPMVGYDGRVMNGAYNNRISMIPRDGSPVTGYKLETSSSGLWAVTPNNNPIDNQFHIFDIIRNGATGYATLKIDGVQAATTNTRVPSGSIPIHVSTACDSWNEYIHCDWFLVRKYLTTEPSATAGKSQSNSLLHLQYTASLYGGPGEEPGEEPVEKELTGKYTVYERCHVFTSSGTLVVPSWARKATFTIQGGGGGGGGGRGGANVQYWGERGYGGGAGSTLISTVSVTPGQILTIVVGNGGSGGWGSGAGGISNGSPGGYGGYSSVTRAGVEFKAMGGSGGSGGSNLYKYRDRSHGMNGTSSYTPGISASDGMPGEDAIVPYGQHVALGGEAGLGGSGYGAGGGGGGGGAWAIYGGGDGGNGGAGAKGHVLICFEVPVEKGITGRSKIHLGRTITGVSDILINQEKELTGLSDILLEAELTGKFDVTHPSSPIIGKYDIGATRTITGKFDVIFPWTTVTGKSDILLEAELTGVFDVIFPWTTVTGKSDTLLSTSITGVFTIPSKMTKTDAVLVSLGESSLVTVLINSTDEVLVALVDMHGRYLQSSDTVLIKGSMEAPPEVGLYGQGDDTILISLGELTRRQFTCTDEALIAVEEGDIRKFFLSTDTVNVALGELTRRQFTKTDTVNAALVETRIIENTAPQADDEVLIALGELTRRQFTCTDEALIAVEEGGPGITARISRADTVLIKVNEITARAFEREDAVLIALGERTRRKFDGVDAVLLAVDETGEVPTVRILSSETVLIALGEEITFPLKQTRVSWLRATTRRRADLDTHLQEGKAKSQVVKVEDTLDTPIEKEEKEEP